jgi:pimeloyl-ACP methyl ester carboxylesterase
MLILLLSIILGCILLIVSVLLYYSPGKPEPFLDKNEKALAGSISEKTFVTTFEQLTSDAIEDTNYLRLRFGKDKIYLMAHSGGTPFAIQAIAKAPQLYNAYIGMAQITRQSESERIAYKYMEERYTAMGNSKALEELKKYPLLDTDTSFVPFYKSITRDNDMHELGIGTMRNMKSVFTGVFLPVWTCKAYTLKEKINIWVSKFKFVKKARFIDELFVMDIPTMFPKLDIPIYFLSGKYDLTVNIDLSKAYLEKLQAPVKGFYTFENSAHSPLFEEPQRVNEIFVSDILKGKTILADS